MRDKDTEHGPNWRGGRVRNGRDGYWHLYRPDHPNATKEGYVAEHRLVMEGHLGRYLTRDEVVHHISQDIDDNRIANLQVMTHAEHTILHNKISTWSERHLCCIECGTFTRPHKGRGYCRSCYDRKFVPWKKKAS